MPTINQTIQKIREFADLPYGWHFGEGGPILDEDIERAENLLRKAEAWGIERSNAFPGVEGEIEITFHHERETLSISFEVDGLLTIVEDSSNNIISDQEGLTLETAEDKLWDFSQKSHTLSESYTYDFGTKKIIDLSDAHSRILAGIMTTPIHRETLEREYLLYKRRAFMRRHVRSASISTDIIRQSRATPSSFGALARTVYQMANWSRAIVHQGIPVTGISSDGLTQNVGAFSLGSTQIPATFGSVMEKVIVH